MKRLSENARHNRNTCTSYSSDFGPVPGFCGALFRGPSSRFRIRCLSSRLREAVLSQLLSRSMCSGIRSASALTCASESGCLHAASRNCRLSERSELPSSGICFSVGLSLSVAENIEMVSVVIWCSPYTGGRSFYSASRATNWRLLGRPGARSSAKRSNPRLSISYCSELEKNT